MVQSAELALSGPQRVLVQRPIENKTFLEGPAGTGKTTVGVARLLHLLDTDVPAHSILVFTPQRTLGAPYYEALHSPARGVGGEVTLLTIGGLAQRMVDLFWPLIVEDADFGHPERPPTFLTLETAQYYMARLVRPLLDQGYFESVAIDRNRLYSQIIDNLNKAAVVGFPYTEIGDRLKAAWGGEGGRERIYEQAQICANRFRRYCLDHNRLDFSLQVEVFLKHLWTRPICHDYLLGRYCHLIVDNVEEDVPVAHDLLGEWLPSARSAFLIYDHQAGYRRFLGADPATDHALAALCDEQVLFDHSFVASPAVQTLGDRLARSLGRAEERRRPPGIRDSAFDIRTALAFESHRYHPQMLDWVAEQIDALVSERKVPPGEIVVLAPFLSDALRFSLTDRLKDRGIPTWSHRPSRALREEPATHCLLTLAAIAHPQWGIAPAGFDVAYALMQAIEGMDLVRAQLLAEIVYRLQDGVPTLGSFDRIRPEMQERLTFVLGERYEGLRSWIQEHAAATEAPQGRKGSEEGGGVPEQDSEPLDHFLSRLFGEVLSQVGYGFHRDYDASEVAANLIESVRKFRWATEGTFDTPPRIDTTKNELSHSQSAKRQRRRNSGQEYVEMVEDGVIAAQYIRSWQIEPEDAVLLAPAFTFIIRNRPVDYQFWLNVGGRGWWERLYQPLTHPYVLSRHWPPSGRENTTWTDTDEVEAREEALHRLVQGLLRRCRCKVYLGLSELGEQGYEQKGALLQAIQRVLRDLPAAPAN
jgi:hypothetical protein